MTGWNALARHRPDLASEGRRLLYQFGVGLAFLGTTTAEGGPRVHPVCPVLSDHGLHLLLIPSPKRDDLRRDGRFALHSFPCEDNEDAFYLTGRAEPEPDPNVEAGVRRTFIDERGWSAPPPGSDLQAVFVLDIERCLLTTTTGHGDPDPRHAIWRAPRST